MLAKALVIILYVALVLLSAFFSCSEITFARANKKRFESEAEKGDKRAQKVKYIQDNYTRSLSTILVGNNLVNIAASSAATVFFVSLLGFKSSGEFLATVITTLTLIIFGETMPKIIAADRPDTLARRFARPLRLCMGVFKPVVAGVEKLVKAISPIWTPEEKQPQTTPDELRIILEDAEEQGVFTEEEGELIDNAIEFSDTMAMEVMTPRVDMIAVDIEKPLDALTSDMLRHSRLPVYRGTIDNIIGVLPTKTFMKNKLQGNIENINEMLVGVVYVHKTRMVSSIIREFRRKRLQMAVVLDEFGGTMGILTMEDIMEEIVGEIFDERDDVEEDCVDISESSHQISGGMNIYDLFDAVEYEPPHDFSTHYTTAGGWATEMLDRFPVPGDTFTYDRLTVTVLEASAHRVETLRVDVAPKPEEEE